MEISKDPMAPAGMLKPMTKPLHHDMLTPRPEPLNETGESAEMAALPPGGRIALPELADDDRSAIAEFRNTLMDAIGTVEFDAAALAESAPQALKDFAEEQGVELESLFAELDTNERLKPSEPSEEFKAFFDTLFNTVQSGEEADLTALAADAPDEVLTIAEVQAKDVESVISEMLARIEDVGSAEAVRTTDVPPPVAPPGDGIDSFLDTLVAAVAAGDVDIDALVEQAPESLNLAATMQGRELADVVSEMVANVQENGDPREADVAPAAQQAVSAYQSELAPTSDDMAARAAVISLIMQA